MGARIVVMEGDERSKIFNLHMVSTTIGRGSSNPIRLTDTSVSRRHAEIIQEGGSYRIRDLRSANGTRLNEKRIRSAYLKPGDQISIGRFALIFELDEAVTPVAAESAKSTDRPAVIQPSPPPIFLDLSQKNGRPFQGIEEAPQTRSWVAILAVLTTLAVFLLYPYMVSIPQKLAQQGKIEPPPEIRAIMLSDEQSARGAAEGDERFKSTRLRMAMNVPEGWNEGEVVPSQRRLPPSGPWDASAWILPPGEASSGDRLELTRMAKPNRTLDDCFSDVRAWFQREMQAWSIVNEKHGSLKDSTPCILWEMEAKIPNRPPMLARWLVTTKNGNLFIAAYTATVQNEAALEEFTQEAAEILSTVRVW